MLNRVEGGKVLKMQNRKISCELATSRFRRKEKESWHRLDLQELRDEKFIYVANKILAGRFAMVKLEVPTILQN
jgi:hypothetical protein